MAHSPSSGERKGNSPKLFVSLTRMMVVSQILYLIRQKLLMISQRILERTARDGNSPVGENRYKFLYLYLSTSGKDNPEGSRQDYTAKAKYLISPIVNQYREGKVKSSELIAVKQNLKPFCLQRVRAGYLIYQISGDGVLFVERANDFTRVAD